MNALTNTLQIRHATTSVEHPQTDGLFERLNRTLKTSLAAYVEDQLDTWDDKLPFVTFAYNTAAQTSVKKSPYEVLFGRKPVLPTVANLRRDNQGKEGKTWLLYLQSHIPIVQEEARENLLRAQIIQKELYNKKRRQAPKFKPGDLILKKVNSDIVPFAAAKWHGP